MKPAISFPVRLVLVALVTFSWATTLFFGYQTWTLRQKVAEAEKRMVSSTSGLETNFKTYTNNFYQLKFRYPSTYTFEEGETGGGYQIILNKGKADQLVVNIAAKSAGNPNLYLDTSPTAERIINEGKWSEFYLPDGYPEGEQATQKPIYALRIVAGNYIYTVSVNGPSLTEEQYQVVYDFEFIK